MGWEAQPGQGEVFLAASLILRSFSGHSAECARTTNHSYITHSDPTPTRSDWKDRTSCGSCDLFDDSFPVCVLGPYGHPPNLGQYGTVVFVLEDIGLFRALPFIRYLVQESRSRRNTVRRLEVLWQVRLKHFNHPHWVGDEISQIIELDRMFDRNDCPEHRHRDDRGFDPVDHIRYRNRTRLKYHFHAINIAKELARLMDSTGGTTAVSVCASNPLRAAVRHVVHPRTSGDCRLIDLDLEPSCTDGDPFVHGTSM
ncbi:hypothetical protein N7505_001333 [Penicillium chrysogenum]|uniref:Uncharacterized protein n=1 Tax=Penicillium chrysogenum TaxID=5076 RepID=A0ABQ8WWQ6_PENCH|nr:hypothetical protein N7505_001333 [Penicillium chrysogenum]